MSLFLSYYGDDFTGSTDVMEALAGHGLTTVLYTRIPTAAESAPFKDFAAAGIAGASRSETPDWMDRNLPGVFEWLKSQGARFCHYKVCSTFDSSPATGSIGRAAEIGARVFGQAMVPLIVGAPELKRYTFAGNLFAGYQGAIHRIDRHPVMSCHPVTPMDEADLRLHLARQTKLPVTLAGDSFAGDWPERGLALLDVHDAETQRRAGERLLDLPSTFVVGSSGVEYALVRAMAAAKTDFARLEPVDRLMAVSGSVSPTTERQIRFALTHGFDGVALDAVALAGDEREELIATATARCAALLGEGRSVIAYTALGPASNAGEKLGNSPGARRCIGEGLGRILAAVLRQSGVRRAIVAGGDSSGHALSALDIHALTTRSPLTATPGSPVCAAHSADPALDGLELATKGGQVGGDGYFVQIRDGVM